MSSKLADATAIPVVSNARHDLNNFTMLRLVLASLVMLFHYWVLTGPNPTIWPFVYPDFAVDGFFMISGFLIYASFDRAPQIKPFAIRRMFRLYPLYLTVVLIQTVAFLAIQPDGIRAHLQDALAYFAANAVFLNFLHNHVGTVMQGLVDPGINPSLWTLKVEVAFYALVPLIRFLVDRWGVRALLCIFAASLLYTAILRHMGDFLFAKELPGAMQYFVAGILLYRYRQAIRLPAYVLWIAAALCMVAATLIQMRLSPLADDHWRICFPFVIAPIIYTAAFALPRLRWKRDISYGVYLIHAPVIQFLIIAGVLNFSPLNFIGLVAFVLALAFLAEWAVERPFIKLGHRLSTERIPGRLPQAT